MTITFSGNHVLVREAAALTNQLLQDTAFFEGIRQHDGFDMSTASPIQIADLMQSSNAVVTVELYKSKNPFSKVLAYEDSRYPNMVFLNSRRLKRSVASICNTIVHECVHALDAAEKGLRFGHGDNYAHGKENTAPYWIGDLAEEVISGEPPEFAQLFAAIDSEWG